MISFAIFCSLISAGVASLHCNSTVKTLVKIEIETCFNFLRVIPQNDVSSPMIFLRGKGEWNWYWTQFSFPTTNETNFV